MFLAKNKTKQKVANKIWLFLKPPPTTKFKQKHKKGTCLQLSPNHQKITDHQVQQKSERKKKSINQQFNPNTKTTQGKSKSSRSTKPKPTNNISNKKTKGKTKATREGNSVKKEEERFTRFRLSRQSLRLPFVN